MLTLSLALLLSVMMSVWFAFYAARRMMLPGARPGRGHAGRSPAATTARASTGAAKNDELGFLVHSFNRMTLQLEQSRAHAEQSRRQVERQRAWLQTVLGQISSGVITLEGGAPGDAARGAEARIRSANDAAVEILGEALAELEGGAARERRPAARGERAGTVRRGRRGAPARPGRRRRRACRLVGGDAGDRRERTTLPVLPRGGARRCGRAHDGPGHRHRRHDRDHRRAARRRLERGRAAARPRDQEPAHPDPALRRAPAPQVREEARGRRTWRCSPASLTPSRTRSTR